VTPNVYDSVSTFELFQHAVRRSAKPRDLVATDIVQLALSGETTLNKLIDKWDYLMM
jgi:hypothetical protein